MNVLFMSFYIKKKLSILCLQLVFFLLQKGNLESKVILFPHCKLYSDISRKAVSS